MNTGLPYDPGRLPTLPSPRPGESIDVEMEGWPPWKDYHFSVRNPRHRAYTRFVSPRQAATDAMAGRAWYHGDVALELELRGPILEAGRSLTDYISGVCDTLDGSHGMSFTCLPVVFADDCQVTAIKYSFVCAQSPCYKLHLTFLE